MHGSCNLKVECDWLRRVNPHALDADVEFIEETHTYLIRGRRALGPGLKSARPFGRRVHAIPLHLRGGCIHETHWEGRVDMVWHGTDEVGWGPVHARASGRTMCPRCNKVR